MKRSPLKRKTPLRRGISKLANVAKRKRAQARKDAEWRKQFLHLHPWCEIGPVLMGWLEMRSDSQAARWARKHPCLIFASEVHERIKRSRGGSTTDATNVMATCRPCHEFTEAHPQAAQNAGLLMSNPKWRNR